MGKRPLTVKAAAALQRVVDKFQSGDLSAIVQATRIKLADDVPAKNWSLRNQVLCLAQCGEPDARTIPAWRRVDRWVKKGTHGIVIYEPRHIFEVDEETGEKKVKFTRYSPSWRHPFGNTDGEPIENYVGVPKAMPPLAGLAERLGIKAKWQPVLPGELGHHVPGKEIVMGTADPQTFFHELAHAIHTALGHKREGVGQDPFRETVASFTACVLMAVYGYGDRSGNSWKYIKAYNPKSPIEAIKDALSTVAEVLGYIETLCEAA